MRMSKEVEKFLVKYNMFVMSLEDMENDSYYILSEIFEDWIFFTLEQLDEDGVIDWFQFNDDQKEYTYPFFQDIETGNSYKSIDYSYIFKPEKLN